MALKINKSKQEHPDTKKVMKQLLKPETKIIHNEIDKKLFRKLKAFLAKEGITRRSWLEAQIRNM
jgi:hypothetical protein